MIGAGAVDPLGFVADELSCRGALVERGGGRVLAVLPGTLARELGLAEALVLTADPTGDEVGCGLGAPLLDRLVDEVRASVPVASIGWEADPPRLAMVERLAERWSPRNAVADLLEVAHAPATYLAGIFAWTAEADDRYQGVTTVVAHGVSASAPDDEATAALMCAIAGDDGRVSEGSSAPGVAVGAAGAIARRAADAIGPRLGEVGAAVARRRDRERDRIDQYFRSLTSETRKPRRSVAPSAVEARVAALRAEHAAKLRDLGARYTLRVRLEPVALAALAVEVAEVRFRVRRRKRERELTLSVPPAARAPDALACAACPFTTRAPVVCDDALHMLCESCAPDPRGRPVCSACAGKCGRV